MPTGDMPEFVGHYALHFIGGVGGFNQTGIEIDPLAARDKGVDLTVVDQHDFDLVRIQFGYCYQRRHHVGKQRLGFSVAEDRLGSDRLRDDRYDSHKGDHETHQSGC